MRACFLGQNVCALGYGVAMLQTQPLARDEETGKPLEGSSPPVAPPSGPPTAQDEAPSDRTETARRRARIGRL